MGKEIERKFLVKNDDWKQHVCFKSHVIQGYLCNADSGVVRVRVKTFTERMRLISEAFITIKGRQHGITRNEYEYAIPAEDGMQMLAMCTTPNINKTRHIVVADGGVTWEVDEFLSGVNKGLVLAEVELQDESQDFALPSWVGEEVTLDERYYNTSLAIHSVLAL